MPISGNQPPTVSAARAAYLDHLPTVETRSLALVNLGRALESYTPTAGRVSPNDANYVTVLDITGRGILISGSIQCANALARNYTMKATIDGSLVFEGVVGTSSSGNSIQITLVFLMGFHTTCLLEMKASDTQGAGAYFGVVLVE